MPNRINQSPNPFLELSKLTIEVPSTIPMSYRLIKPPAPPQTIAIFLHGYSDNGTSFARRLYPQGLPNDFLSKKNIAVLIPNGPFPTPVKTESGWKEAYSWYFFDEEKKSMLLSPDTAVHGIEDILKVAKLENLPTTLIGFSQGGFLAPYLAQNLKSIDTEKLILIGSGYRKDYYVPLQPRTSLEVHAIHGTDDEVFNIKQTKKAHREILDLGFSGGFFEVKNTAHIATEEIGRVIAKLL